MYTLKHRHMKTKVKRIIHIQNIFIERLSCFMKQKSYYYLKAGRDRLRIYRAMFTRQSGLNSTLLALSGKPQGTLLTLSRLYSAFFPSFSGTEWGLKSSHPSVQPGRAHSGRRISCHASRSDWICSIIPAACSGSAPGSLSVCMWPICDDLLYLYFLKAWFNF